MSGMDDFELALLQKHPEWQTVLQGYFDRYQELRSQSADGEAWISRIAAIPGIESTVLSSIHGKLIAHGFLKFEVGARDAGVLYQLTTLGRQAVSNNFLSLAEPEDAELAAAG
jgi:hypothetical protein